MRVNKQVYIRRKGDYVIWGNGYLCERGCLFSGWGVRGLGGINLLVGLYGLYVDIVWCVAGRERKGEMVMILQHDPWRVGQQKRARHTI